MENSDLSNDNYNILEKNTSSSGVVERPVNTSAKRQKISISRQNRRASLGGNDLNLGFVETFDSIIISRKTRTSLNSDCSKGTSKSPKEICKNLKKIQNLSPHDNATLRKSRKTAQNDDEHVNISYVAERSPFSKNEELLGAARIKLVGILSTSKREGLLETSNDTPQINGDKPNKTFESNNRNVREASKYNKGKLNTIHNIEKTETPNQKQLCNLQINEIDLDKSFIDKDEVAYYRSKKHTKCNEVNQSFIVTKQTRSTSRASTKKFGVSLNTAFVADIFDGFESCEGTGRIDRRKRQRRLSGLFPRTLNDAFIGDIGDLDEENLPNSETIAVDNTSMEENYKSAEESVVNYFKVDTNPEPLTENKSSNTSSSSKTPIKPKLRKRRCKKVTEEDILKYYTAKTVKIKKKNLETISENPLSQKTSVRKYKRYIDFNERMSDVKKKKRHAKVVKYKLWENLSPVSMEYFVTKMLDVEISF